MDDHADTELKNILPVSAFRARYPEIAGSESAMRDRIYHARRNGLAAAGAIIRTGRRVLIHVPSYRDWLLKHRETAQ